MDCFAIARNDAPTSPPLSSPQERELRHCEERSNPENKNLYLFSNTCFFKIIYFFKTFHSPVLSEPIRSTSPLFFNDTIVR